MKRQKVLFLLLGIMLVGLLSACGTTESEAGDAKQGETNVNGSESKEENKENDAEEAKKEEDETVELIKTDATFNGQIDPHSIEVETKDGILVLQVTETGEDDWSFLEVGAKLSIEYQQTESGQNNLVHYSVK